MLALDAIATVSRRQEWCRRGTPQLDIPHGKLSGNSADALHRKRKASVAALARLGVLDTHP
jgi:hypothetical protein